MGIMVYLLSFYGYVTNVSNKSYGISCVVILCKFGKYVFLMLYSTDTAAVFYILES